MSVIKIDFSPSELDEQFIMLNQGFLSPFNAIKPIRQALRESRSNDEFVYQILRHNIWIALTSENSNQKMRHPWAAVCRQAAALILQGGQELDYTDKLRSLSDVVSFNPYEKAPENKSGSYMLCKATWTLLTMTDLNIKELYQQIRFQHRLQAIAKHSLNISEFNRISALTELLTQSFNSARLPLTESLTRAQIATTPAQQTPYRPLPARPDSPQEHQQYH